jgi:hypothetical protein
MRGYLFRTGSWALPKDVIIRYDIEISGRYASGSYVGGGLLRLAGARNRMPILGSVIRLHCAFRLV